MKTQEHTRQLRDKEYQNKLLVMDLPNLVFLEELKEQN